MPANQYSDSLLMDALRGSLSNLESLGRGAAVAPIGLLGDINALAREYVTPRLPQSVQGLLQAAPAAPTTEQILSNIPRVSKPRMETSGMEQLGAAMNPRGPVDLARGAGRLAGSAVNEAMVYGRGPLASITPQPMRMVEDTGGLLAPTRESFVQGVPAGQEMIVHHNISPQKLANVQKVGGMPVPSIAVSNVENPMMNFGDISLIGPKEMAIPSAKNPVYGFDAYTARAPKIDYQIDPKSAKNLKGMFSDVADDVGDYKLDKLTQNWEDRQYSEPMMAKFLKEKGALPDKKDFDADWKYSQALSDGVYNLRSEYGDWLGEFNNRLSDAGVNIKERIFKGYTDSGNRRYAPATLENLVKEMKGGAGSENFNYGIGNLRAVASPKFRKLDDIKTSRDKIVPSEEFKKVKEEINDAYDALTHRIYKLSDKEGYGYSPTDVLYDIGQARNVNLLDRFKSGADDQLKADIGIFIKKLQQLPTEYFEIKPQRAVSVSEFEGAIVPANAPKRSIEYLRNQGINDIYFYETPEERKALFKKFGNQMFGAAPALPALGLLGSEEE